MSNKNGIYRRGAPLDLEWMWIKESLPPSNVFSTHVRLHYLIVNSMKSPLVHVNEVRSFRVVSEHTNREDLSTFSRSRQQLSWKLVLFFVFTIRPGSTFCHSMLIGRNATFFTQFFYVKYSYGSDLTYNIHTHRHFQCTENYEKLNLLQCFYFPSKVSFFFPVFSLTLKDVFPSLHFPSTSLTQSAQVSPPDTVSPLSSPFTLLILLPCNLVNRTWNGYHKNSLYFMWEPPPPLSLPTYFHFHFSCLLQKSWYWAVPTPPGLQSLPSWECLPVLTLITVTPPACLRLSLTAGEGKSEKWKTAMRRAEFSFFFFLPPLFGKLCHKINPKLMLSLFAPYIHTFVMKFNCSNWNK